MKTKRRNSLKENAEVVILVLMMALVFALPIGLPHVTKLPFHWVIGKQMQVVPFVSDNDYGFYSWCDFLVTRQGLVKRVDHAQRKLVAADGNFKVNKSRIMLGIPTHLYTEDNNIIAIVRSTLYMVDEVRRDNRITRATCNHDSVCDELIELDIKDEQAKDKSN